MPTEPTAKSPYPGLRPFRRNEAYLFYGRNSCIRAMVHTLEETRFLAVLGPSGSGKSSLVRSGLFMHLQGGAASKAGSRWTFLDIRHPRQQPYRELAREVLRLEQRQFSDEFDDLYAFPDGSESPEPVDDEAVDERERTLRRNPMTLVRWWKENRPHPDQNLLLLVDQFEELFGYGQASERGDIDAFVELLLQSRRSNESPVYVVLTMRSEFLGGCTLFPGLAEQINKSLSLTPRMTREECEAAIVGPVDPSALELDPLLVVTLLNDMNSLAPWTEDDPDAAQAEDSDGRSRQLSHGDLIARRADQLPLMQHVLNWMWTLASEKERDPAAPVRLTLDNYLALGRLRGAVSEHAQRLMAATGDAELTERIFRALTDQPSMTTAGSAESVAIRRPRTIAQLADETGADIARVIAVVEIFRAEGVSMLTPGVETVLKPDTPVDIAHESLIRQWSDLRGWIREEGDRGRSWGELIHDSEQEGSKKAELLRGLELAERRRWWKRSDPRPGWAERYGGRFDEVDTFLKRSIVAQRRRRSLGYAGTGGLFVMAAGFVLAAGTANDARALAEEARASAAFRTAALEKSARRAQSKATEAREMALRERFVAQRSRAEAASASRQAAAATASARRLVASATAEARSARSEREAARRESQALLQLSENSVNNIIRPLVRWASSNPFAWGDDLSDGGVELPFQADIAPLEAMFPRVFAGYSLDSRVERAELAAARLEVPRLVEAADDLDLTAARQSVPELGLLMQSQALSARGRAQLLNRNLAEAISSFREASRLAPAPSGDNALAARQARAGAQLGLAQALLESGEQAQALLAAEECLRGIEAEPGGDVDAAPDESFESRLIKTDCLLVRAASGPVGEPALTALEQAAVEIDNLESERGMFAEAYRAKVDLGFQFLRLRRRSQVRHIDLVNYSNVDEVLESVEPLFEGPGDAISSRIPANAFAELAFRNEGIALLFEDWPGELRRRREYDPTIGPALDEAEGNLRFVIDNVPAEGNSGVFSRLSEQFAALIDNRMKDARSVDAEDLVADPFVDAFETMSHYAGFLDSHAGLQSNEDRRQLTRRAAELLTDLRQGVPAARYPALASLAAAVRTTTSTLCDGGSSPSTSPECDRLRETSSQFLSDSEAGIGALQEKIRMANSQESFGRVWADEDGIALGGHDPLSCAEAQPGAHAREVEALDETASELGAATSFSSGGEELATPTCQLRAGRYQFLAVWDGMVWMFESRENLRAFGERGQHATRYLPQFGGFDAHSLANGIADLGPIEGPLFAVYADGRLYLSAHQGITFAVTGARANWAERLRNPPSPAPREASEE